MDSPTNSNAIKQEGRKSRSPSVDPIHPNEQAIVPLEEAPHPHPHPHPHPYPHPDEDHLQLAIRDEDREYGCKFCDKKFSNKQALGGHQNAHKLERSTEKNNPNMHDAPLDFYAAAAAPPNPPPVLGPYNQRNDLLNRAYIPWPYNPNQQQQQPQQQQYYAAARPVMQMQMPIQMPEPNYGPRPVYNNNNVYQGWNQVPARLPYNIANNPNYLNQGGYIGFQAQQRPVYDFQPAPAGFPAQLRLGLDRNPAINFANLRNAEDVDETGLDLRLRL